MITHKGRRYALKYCAGEGNFTSVRVFYMEWVTVCVFYKVNTRIILFGKVTTRLLAI
jgi:hypothetical protein